MIVLYHPVQKAHGFFARSDFLGPDIGVAHRLAPLMTASLVTSFIGVFTGAAGGIVLLGLMAMVMPPLALIPCIRS